MEHISEPTPTSLDGPSVSLNPKYLNTLNSKPYTEELNLSWPLGLRLPELIDPHIQHCPIDLSRVEGLLGCC